MRQVVFQASCWASIVFLCHTSGSGQEPDDATRYQQAVANAIRFLTHEGQRGDGSYHDEAEPGVTALVTTALLRHGMKPGDQAVARSLKYLEGFVQPDGGIYRPGSAYQNYETCLAILCFSQANVAGRYNLVLTKAERFVQDLQWDEGEGADPQIYSYGGAGYGKHNRPDLSNTQFLLEALHDLGHDENSLAVQKALIFVSRCQNLDSEYNTTPFADKNPDGGFYYTPAAGGTSQAGTTPSGGLRSYGSMTYAGLKSMIFAGVGPKDPRVEATLKWIRLNYDLTTNPGMGNAGLYYYYHTFAKALDAHGEDVFVDAQGHTHYWRQELLRTLAERQLPNGSWVNKNDRWMEGDPNLVTGYALLTLAYCRPDAAGR
jgi:squalene-hopene/tetraprenyl-beta-curcumene cyclase